jgi:glycerol-3-phosphate acyltransferase PlsY
MLLKIFALLAFGYLLGSVPFGWLVLKVYRNQDLRRLGSGNIGAANVYRAAGLGAFITTLTADGLKGAIPVLAGIVLGFSDQEILLALIGLFTVMGHAWPLFLGFKGGKGVATTGGVFLVLAPVATIVSLISWVFLIRVTRLASLSSLIAVSAGYLTLLILHFIGWQAWRPVGWPVIALGTILFGLVIYLHRANIQRLLRGRELKITTQHQ